MIVVVEDEIAAIGLISCEMVQSRGQGNWLITYYAKPYLFRDDTCILDLAERSIVSFHHPVRVMVA